MTKETILEYLKSIGTKGGKAGTGASKDRRISSGDPDFYKKQAAKRKPKTKKAKA